MASVPPRPSFPSATTEPGIRRLGVRSSAHLERPIRSQVIVAVGLALLLLAIPLYLLRRPDPEPEEKASDAPVGFAPSVPVEAPPSEAQRRVSVGKPLKVRCGPNATAVGQEGGLCENLPVFEAALTKAIEDTVDCAPRTGEEGSLNYVLKVDFTQKTMHVFPGASGTWKGPQARRAAQCVKQALPAPEWDKIQHKQGHYEIAILATYRPPGPSTAPMFE